MWMWTWKFSLLPHPWRGTPVENTPTPLGSLFITVLLQNRKGWAHTVHSSVPICVYSAHQFRRAVLQKQWKRWEISFSMSLPKTPRAASEPLPVPWASVLSDAWRVNAQPSDALICAQMETASACSASIGTNARPGSAPATPFSILVAPCKQVYKPWSPNTKHPHPDSASLELLRTLRACHCQWCIFILGNSNPPVSYWPFAAWVLNYEVGHGFWDVASVYKAKPFSWTF